MDNPFQQIRRDLKEVASFALMAGQFLEPSELQVKHEKRIRKILKRYRFKVRELPQFYATTK